MNSQYNFRLFIIRLLLTTCFVGGTTSAPIDTEVEIDNSGPEAKDVKEEMLSSESKLTEVIKEDPRALPNPFLPAIQSALPGKETSGSSGLPGLPDLSSATDGAKLYLGAFQVMEMPMPKITDMVSMLGGLGNLGNMAGKIPGLPNPASPSST